MWKLGAPIDAGMFEIKVLKRPIVALMESNQERSSPHSDAAVSVARVFQAGVSQAGTVLTPISHKQEKSRLFRKKVL